MNRLRDWEDGLLSSDKGVELLRRTPPTPGMPELKRRVWAALQREPAREPAWGWLPRLRAVAVGVVIALVAGTAGAVMTRRWVFPDIERTATTAAPPSDGARRERRRSAKEASPTLPLAAPVDPGDVVEPLDEVAPVEVVPGRVREVPRAAKATAPKTHALPETAARERAEERTEVLDAMVAHRRDRDPQRAGLLLDRYLSRHRQGALREEALALATEAADARGDGAAAERLARLYEADYPNGRFQQFARNHLSSKPSSAQSPSQ